MRQRRPVDVNLYAQAVRRVVLDGRGERAKVPVCIRVRPRAGRAEPRQHELVLGAVGGVLANGGREALTRGGPADRQGFRISDVAQRFMRLRGNGFQLKNGVRP